jgi:hypothetical protein
VEQRKCAAGACPDLGVNIEWHFRIVLVRLRRDGQAHLR